MAGEKKGKAYEAFAKVALETLQVKRVFKGEIFWDECPDEMTIIPDFTIGPDKNRPSILFLINHSGSSGDSHKKFWRNVGELCEVKILLTSKPLCFVLMFDPIVKEDLKLAQAASFDGQLIVGDLDYGNELQYWIDANLKRFPKDKDEKVTFLNAESKSDNTLKKLLRRFADDLESLLKRRAPKELDALWTIERLRKHSTRVPRARNTFVRRGLSKLLIFEDIELAIKLFSGKRVKADALPAYAYELELAGKAMGRAMPMDEEITNAVTLLGSIKIKSLHRRAPVAKIDGWLTMLRNIGHLTIMTQYTIANYSDLTQPEKLLRNLKNLHEDSNALVRPKGVMSWPPPYVWLFDVLMELIKADSKQANGYGYAQLGREVIDAGHGTSTDLKSANQFGGGFGLSAWISRKPESGFRGDLLKGCAEVLSTYIAGIGEQRCEKLALEIKKQVVNNIVESKLCTYKGFEPLKLLIEDVVHNCSRVSYRSCFGERAGLSGQATKTTVLQKGKTLINWQSAHASHTNDKKKELCGRAVALRYSWDPDADKFIPRPGIEKLILVVDGTWRRDDLNALARAGWDEIYYPDEMAELAEAIV